MSETKSERKYSGVQRRDRKTLKKIYRRVVFISASTAVVTIVILLKKDRIMTENHQALHEIYDLLQRKYDVLFENNLTLTEDYLALVDKYLGQVETVLPIIEKAA